MLEAKVHELEAEAETKAHSKEDKARHVKLMEVRYDEATGKGFAMPLAMKKDLQDSRTPQ